MGKRNKIKLSTVTVVSISIILIGLTLTLSYVSINSIKSFGKHSIKIDEQSTRDNAMLYFLEITRRTAIAYSVYLDSIEDMVKLLASQVEEVINGNIKYASTGNNRLKLDKYNNKEFYFLNNDKNYNCFYFGNDAGVEKADIQVNKLLHIMHLFKTSYYEHPAYITCVWLQTNKKLHIEYPKYYNLKKINIDPTKKYFENIFSEFSETRKTKNNKSIWTHPYKDISGRLNLDVYRIIYSASGKFLAAVGIDLSFKKVVNTIVNNSLFPSRVNSSDGVDEIKSKYNNMKGFIFIVDKDGSIIIFPNKYSNLLSLPAIEYSNLKTYPDKLKVNLNDSLNPNIKNLAEDIKQNDIGVNRFSLKGENYIIAHKGILSIGWVLCFATLEKSLMTSVEETKDTMNATKEEMIERFTIISLVFLIIFIVATILFFKFFLLKPLLKLREKVKTLGVGDFDITLDETGFAEIADLSITFNSLTDELKNYTVNLEKEIKQRQSIETELEIAGKLQDSVLPKITDEFISNKFEIYAKLIPAKEMSGDFYDFFYVKEDTLCIVVADVCGKGITAAFYMSMAKAIIKEACLKAESLDTGKIVEKINNTLNESVKKKPMFLTMYLVFYNINTGLLTYTNAGHGAYIGVDSNGNVTFQGEAHNSFVGFFDNIEYKSSKIELKSGEIFVLYTDGIIEAYDMNENLYGNEKLQNILKLTYKQKLSKIGDSIFNDVIEFQSGNQSDDITLVMLKRK